MNKLQASLAIGAYIFALNSQAALFDDKEARKKILDVETNSLANHELQSAEIEGLSKRMVDQLLNMQNEIELLKQEISELRGELEVVNHALATADKRQRDLYADTDRRIRKIESSLSGDSVGVLAPPSEGGGADTDVVDAYKAYKTAYGFSQKSDHKAAFDAYNTFIATYPNSKYMPDAIYGLGYSQFALKNYKSSIASQKKLLAIYPSSAKASNAMYSIANSQIQLGQVSSAKKMLRSLIAKYPSAAVIPNAEKRLKVLESIK
ncbi:MAG: tol-pal system protein YbgF [Methylophilaceae bacterium]|jgi:tol-pal system protein YbgF